MVAASHISITTAAEQLEGLMLNGGWRVTERLEPGPAATGGNFCVGYLVQNDDGRKGFCKALNLARALADRDPAWLVQQLVEGYNFERDLLRKCNEKRLTRVVLAVDDGVVEVPGALFANVNYIIFELATSDIRAALAAEEALDIAARLRSLHHVATGLKQLHGQQIAHQDLKPSNVLVFRDAARRAVSKVGDLGRACDRSRPAAHDTLNIAGDYAYAPPEQLYRATPTEFGPRRLACDLYQLGSLTAFVFTGASINTLLKIELHPSHAWQNWSGGYDEALPYVRDAFGRALARLRAACPSSIAEDLVRVVSYLCEPDPARRGHPVALRRRGNPYELERVVTDLDLLCRHAEVRLTGVAA